MTIANHVLAGAIIGTLTTQPLIALPAAFVSHFVLDAVPHFGFKNWEQRQKYKSLMTSVIRIDALIFFIVAAWLLLQSPPWLVILSGAAAASPDLAWAYRYGIKEKFGKLPPGPTIWFNKFHAGIQVLEFRYGFIIEYPVVALFMWILAQRLA